MPALRALFFGTAEFASASLDSLARQPALALLGVVTQPDRPRGRGLRPLPTPAKQTALRLGLTVWQPEKCRQPDFLEQLRKLAPELIVVAAYGQILPQALLDLPRCGCLNVHASLLPKYRGAAPIQWAILNDERETGVSLMQMDAGLDTGPVLATSATTIDDLDDAQSLHDRLARLGGDLLARALPEHIAGRIAPCPQPAATASYARKIVKEDGHLDWNQPARALWNRVRALVPWPGTYTIAGAAPKPTLLKVWRATVESGPRGAPGQILQADRNGVLVACRDGALRVTELQREGGRRMPAAEFLAGNPLPLGLMLGEQNAPPASTDISEPQ